MPIRASCRVMINKQMLIVFRSLQRPNGHIVSEVNTIIVHCVLTKLHAGNTAQDRECSVIPPSRLNSSQKLG